MHEIYDKCAPTVKFIKLDACGEDMIPLSFKVKPDGQAQIVPNQPVKVSYATVSGIFDQLLLLVHLCFTQQLS